MNFSMNEERLADKAASSIRIVKRGQRISKRSAIELADIRLAAFLPVYAAIAWSIPSRRWHDLIRRSFASIDEKGSLLAISRGIEASGLEARLPSDRDAIARELNVNRLESYLQYLQDYRPGGWQGNFSIDNEIILRRGLQAGRGVLLWVGHFVFNGLPLKKALDGAGYRVFHHSRPEHGFSSSRFGVRVLNPLRSHVESRYLARRIIIERGAEHRAMREAHQLLSKGEIVSITAGHWEGKRIAFAPIGDAFLPISVGAPSLAHATRATLLPIFIVHDRTTARFRVVVGEPINCDKMQERDEVVRFAVADLARQLIPLVAAYPDQWRGWKYLSEDPP